MPNISEDLQRIREAKYGEEVRSSIHDSIRDINEVVEANVSTVTEITNQAKSYRDNAATQASQATAQATIATNKASEATTQATKAETEAGKAKVSEDNSEEWYEKTKAIAESLEGALRPCGTIIFADLPAIDDPDNIPGDMWNISDSFTTTADFEEGAGVQVPAGSNVYLTIHNKWDVLAGSRQVKVENGVLYITPSLITI